MGDELGASVGGDVRGNSVLGEDMEYEELGQLRGCDCVEGRYEYPLLGESVNDDEDSGETGGFGEFLNKVHRDRIPWFLQDRELLERAVGSVSRSLGPSASGTGFAEVLYERLEIQPDIFMMNKFKHLVLPKVSC